MAKVRDMTQGRPARLILSFALPLMLGNMFQQMYVMVDTMVVGKFVGVDALASLGAADWLNWLVIGLVQGLTQGFSIQISQRFGAEDWDGLNRAITGTILLSGAVGAVLTAAALLLAEPVLLLLHTPADILPGSLDYLHVMFSGTLALVGYNAFASILRAMGNSRTPLIAMVIASVLNVGLDLLFVLVFHWGIAGAAGATVLAQVVSCLICLWAMRGLPIPRIEKSQWRLSAPLMRRLFSLGAPLALQNTIIAVGGMAVQSVVNGFGVLFVAGYTATNKLYGLLEIAATSFGFSMATYTGQNLGAKRYDRIRSGIRAGRRMAVLTALVISALMILLGRYILMLFISGDPQQQEQVMAVAYRYLFIMGVMLFVLYLLHVYRSSLQGMGDTIVPMASGFIEMFMRVGSVLFLPAFVGQDGVFFAEVIAWAGAAVLLIVMFYVRLRRLESGLPLRGKKTA
ncbi:MAG TPA: MATE family efflux transporter [Candidatus Caccousia avicola]|uniref:MATE family efflux transporter n=1 Tax=Candidatus Caccousia avicola TaxID=2840721 RepID=A0A9D1AMJ7_9FIRM|nr:MATE family efflux transporter [Candidatus Caccousia avicola]